MLSFEVEGGRDAAHRVQEEPSDKAIVLVHGLTDSPYFMTAVGDYFFSELGYDVYMPLLQCHGLREPKGMEGVDLKQWKANVDFAIDEASKNGGVVSIGGLSTGGTLSFYTAVNNAKVTGALYLFSAALDLAGKLGGLVGDLAERVLRTFLVDVLDKNEPLIGANPYRYCRMDLDGARELAKLIKETDDIIEEIDPKQPVSRRIFAAHSESDTTANIEGIEGLQKVCDPSLFTFFRIPEADGVSHASLVLSDPVYAIDASEGDRPLEAANPRFSDMMGAMAGVA